MTRNDKERKLMNPNPKISSVGRGEAGILRKIQGLLSSIVYLYCFFEKRKGR